MSKIIDRILAEVCVDERIPDGVFDMSNNVHMEVLRENLSDNMGLSLEDTRQLHNKMLEGKYPERQAYNKDGLLVTFPTPQHKAKAISRGTHFEQDPTKGASGPQNVFPGGQQPQQGQTQGQPPAAPQGQAPAQNVFPSGPQTPGAQSAPPPPSGVPPGGGATPPPQPPAQPPPPPALPNNTGLAVEPTNPGPGGVPPPNFETPKSPEQKAAEAQVVKGLMRDKDVTATLPNLMERRYVELNRVYNFCKEMGYMHAMGIISEAMNTQ